MSGVIADRDMCLGWVHGGSVRAEFMQSVLVLRDDPQAGALTGRYHTVNAATAVGFARSALCSDFLAMPEQWLLMVDTDIVFTPGTVARLAAAADPDRYPVLSPLIWHLPDVTQGRPAPMIYTRAQAADGTEGFTLRRTWPADEILRVDAAGAGMLLMHRAALEAISAAEGGGPCWFRTIAAGKYDLGDDMSFCRRAHLAGVPLHVDTGARAGHAKTVILGG